MPQIKYLRMPDEIIDLVKDQQQGQQNNYRGRGGNRGDRGGDRGRGGRGGRGRGRGGRGAWNIDGGGNELKLDSKKLHNGTYDIHKVQRGGYISSLWTSKDFDTCSKFALKWCRQAWQVYDRFTLDVRNRRGTYKHVSQQSLKPSHIPRS